MQNAVITAQKNIFSFSKCSEKMVFPKKKRTGIWSSLYYQERWYFFFPKISSYSLDGKWNIICLIIIHGNMIFSSNVLKRHSFQKIVLKYDLSFCIIWIDDISFSNTPKRWSFQKRSRWNMIFLVLSGKMVSFSVKYDIFPLDGKWKMIFLKKYMELWYFLHKCINVRNMKLPFCKKHQR